MTSFTSLAIAPDGSCGTGYCNPTTVGYHGVTATFNGKTAHADLTVTVGALDHITISPTNSTISAGGSQPYSVEAWDLYGNDLGNVTTFTSLADNNGGTCVVGSCTASLAGGHTITATYLTKSALASLTVAAGSLDHLVLSPATSSILSGGSQGYTAVGMDALNNSLGDMTSTTTFSMTPDGSCTLANCSATITGSHQVMGNKSGHIGFATLTVASSDTTPPTVSSIALGGSSPTKASSVTFSVTFSEPVTGVDQTDFSVVQGGSVSGASISNVSGSGSSYTVTVATGSGSGTVGLNLVDNDTIIDGAANMLGGIGLGNGNFTGAVYTIDKTAPLVSSINTADANPTNAASVNWTVTFSEPVSGVVAGTFALVNGGLGGTPAVTGVTGGPTIWTVTASTGTGAGSLGLNATTAGSVVDSVGNALGGLPFTGQAYTITVPGPTVSNVTSSTANGSYRAGQAISIQVTFSAAVTVTGTPTLALNSGGTASYASGSGTSTLTFTYTVGAGQNSADLDYTSTSALALSGGTIQNGAAAAILTLPAPGAAGSLGANKAIVIDTTAPVLAITAPTSNASQNTTSRSVSFTATDGGSGINAATVSLQRQVAAVVANACPASGYANDGAAVTSAISPVNSTGLTNGCYQWVLSGSDLAGNAGTTATSARILVDTTAPTGTFTAPLGATSQSSTSVTASWTESDGSGSGVAEPLAPAPVGRPGLERLRRRRDLVGQWRGHDGRLAADRHRSRHEHLLSLAGHRHRQRRQQLHRHLGHRARHGPRPDGQQRDLEHGQRLVPGRPGHLDPGHLQRRRDGHRHADPRAQLGRDGQLRQRQRHIDPDLHLHGRGRPEQCRP